VRGPDPCRAATILFGASEVDPNPVAGAYVSSRCQMVEAGNHGREPAPARVEVEFRPARAPTFAAAIRLLGEHDMATIGTIKEALAPINGSVLVDLSDCAFIDSSAINVFVSDSHSRMREGHRLELFVPNENATVARTLQVSGLDAFLNVRAAFDD
jgi:anti-anti-sigma factor